MTDSLFPSAAKTDGAAMGLTLEVIIRVRCVCADQSSSNYLVKANFRIKITSSGLCAWAPTGILGWDQINPRVELMKAAA